MRIKLELSHSEAFDLRDVLKYVIDEGPFEGNKAEHMVRVAARMLEALRKAHYLANTDEEGGQ